MMSFWLLFIAKDKVEYTPKKWRKYTIVKNKQSPQPAKETKETEQEESTTPALTPSEVKQADQAFFLTFDSQPFLPKTSNKGKGRPKNTQLKPRIRHPVVKKSQSKTEIKLKMEKIE